MRKKARSKAKKSDSRKPARKKVISKKTLKKKVASKVKTFRKKTARKKVVKKKTARKKTSKRKIARKTASTAVLPKTPMVARASISINASTERVWSALVSPEAIKQYMFGANVVSEWREGSPIIWKGEWQGKSYEDKGTIIKFDSGRTIQYSHFSPLSGLPDKAENYHTVTIELSAEGNQTIVYLTQDNNTTEEERAHSEKNWGMMLAAMKRFLEQ